MPDRSERRLRHRKLRAADGIEEIGRPGHVVAVGVPLHTPQERPQADDAGIAHRLLGLRVRGRGEVCIVDLARRREIDEGFRHQHDALSRREPRLEGAQVVIG